MLLWRWLCFLSLSSWCLWTHPLQASEAEGSGCWQGSSELYAHFFANHMWCAPFSAEQHGLWSMGSQSPSLFSGEKPTSRTSVNPEQPLCAHNTPYKSPTKWHSPKISRVHIHTLHPNYPPPHLLYQCEILGETTKWFHFNSKTVELRNINL